MVASTALTPGGLSFRAQADRKDSFPGHQTPLKIRLEKGRTDKGTWTKRPVEINIVLRTGSLTLLSYPQIPEEKEREKKQYRKH